MGRMAVPDAKLILRGLPPLICKRADPSAASRMRSGNYAYWRYS
jgi:hypothetical protein